MAYFDDPYRKERERAAQLNQINDAKYEPAFCDQILEHFENGGSFKTFAEKIDVPSWVISHWQRKFPEFGLACMAAREVPGAKHFKYNPMYCDMVIKERSQGKTLDACAGKIGVSRKTIRYWYEHIPEFADAVDIAESKAQEFWENVGVLAANGKIKNFQSKVWDLVMRSQFDWNPKSEIKHEMSGPNGSPIPVAAAAVVEIYIPDNGRDKPEQQEQDD